MRLLDALQQCGKHGVISRASWVVDPNRSPPVVLVRSFDATTGRAVLIQVDDHQIGNWDPTDDDQRATDWLVVAKSVRWL